MIRIERYRNTRFWAVYDGTELVCVTVYKRGANSVRTRLEKLTNDSLDVTASVASDGAATAAIAS